MLYECNSLKEKRQVIRSLVGRIKSRFNVSIAEVELLDLWNKSVIGFAYVANDTGHVNEALSKVINFIDNDHRVEIIEKYIEIL